MEADFGCARAPGTRLIFVRKQADVLNRHRFVMEQTQRSDAHGRKREADAFTQQER